MRRLVAVALLHPTTALAGAALILLALVPTFSSTASAGLVSVLLGVVRVVLAPFALAQTGAIVALGAIAGLPTHGFAWPARLLLLGIGLMPYAAADYLFRKVRRRRRLDDNPGSGD